MLIPPRTAVALLPAASIAVPLALSPAPSLASVASAGQVVMPDRASAQVKWMVTLPLYQPFALGGVVAAPSIVGAVLSILTIATWLALLPAWSTAVPGTAWSLPS